MNKQLSEKLKTLPNAPGVYFHKDVEGKIIEQQKLNGNSHIEMHNQNWAPGIYLYSLTNGTKIYAGGRIVVR